MFWDAGDALDVQGQVQAHGAISRRRKLPWRYRWPDAVRDAEELAQGLHGKGGKKIPLLAASSGAGLRRQPTRPILSRSDWRYEKLNLPLSTPP
ncbi:MAG: hypothetical protein VKL58_00935 [Cyanobacteriota bacterium]|nr:hypothetical protein [Cyanobacteriota bacterium]